MRRSAFLAAGVVCCCVFGFVYGAGDGNGVAVKWPKLWIESVAVELGVIGAGQGEIRGVVPYMNEGDGGGPSGNYEL